MAALNNLLHYITPTNVVAALHLHQHRRITVRHVFLALGVAVVLTTLYYTYLRRDEMFFASEEVFFWPPETPQIWAERAAQVKQAFRHAYRGYEQHAFPRDELMPMSNKGTDK